ncbi:hypothetical protein C2W59_02471 [Bacillus pumilus]|nr:hypothetical protein C2W59_02471 [Bacillus pumilus]
MKEIGIRRLFVYAYIFLGKKRVLEKIYYDINREKKAIQASIFAC